MFLFRVRHCGARPELDHGRADAVFDLIRSGNAPQQGDAGFAAGVGIRARIGMKPPLADYITHLQIWKERVAYYVLCQIGALVCLSHSGDGSLISTSPRGSRPACKASNVPAGLSSRDIVCSLGCSVLRPEPDKNGMKKRAESFSESDRQFPEIWITRQFESGQLAENGGWHLWKNLVLFCPPECQKTQEFPGFFGCASFLHYPSGATGRT